MKKQLTDKQAWSLIEQMGWGRTSQNYDALAREWYAKLGKDGMNVLRNFVGSRVSDLYHAVEKYEATGKDIDIGSDDGMSDLLHHVVGLGESYFKSYMDNPKLLARRYREGEYKESFAYCFLEPEPPRTKEQKEMAEIALRGVVKTVQDQFSAVQKAMFQLERDMDALALSYSIVEMDKKSAWHFRWNG